MSLYLVQIRIQSELHDTFPVRGKNRGKKQGAIEPWNIRRRRVVLKKESTLTTAKMNNKQLLTQEFPWVLMAPVLTHKPK